MIIPIATIAIEDRNTGVPWQEWASWQSHSRFSPKGHLRLEKRFSDFENKKIQTNIYHGNKKGKILKCLQQHSKMVF